MNSAMPNLFKASVRQFLIKLAIKPSTDATSGILSFGTINSRLISNTRCLYKENPKNLKGSSAKWITRHINDPYVKNSRYKNYRARSAFKLIEIDDKYHIIKPGMCIIDCGAAPGAWTQVAVQRCNSNAQNENMPVGTVIAIDILNINPIEGSKVLTGCDLTKEESKSLIIKELKGILVDLFLSDMAPNASGIKQLDQDLITSLGLEALKLGVRTLKPGGTFLAKTWHGRNINKLENTIAKYFNFVKIVKPPASRDDSAEIYILAKDFLGSQPST